MVHDGRTMFKRPVYLDAIIRADGWLLGFVVRDASKDGTTTPYMEQDRAQPVTIEVDRRWGFLKNSARRYEVIMASRGRW